MPEATLLNKVESLCQTGTHFYSRYELTSNQ